MAKIESSIPSLTITTYGENEEVRVGSPVLYIDENNQLALAFPDYGVNKETADKATYSMIFRDLGQIPESELLDETLGPNAPFENEELTDEDIAEATRLIPTDSSGPIYVLQVGKDRIIDGTCESVTGDGFPNLMDLVLNGGFKPSKGVGVGERDNTSAYQKKL